MTGFRGFRGFHGFRFLGRPLLVCQTRLKGDVPFLDYSQKKMNCKKTKKNHKKICIFAGEVYLMICVQ